MKINNKLVIISLLIILLVLFTGCVNAGSIDDSSCAEITDAGSVDTSDLYENPVVYSDVENAGNPAGNFTELAQEVSNGGSLVTLSKNYTMLSGETHVDISRSNFVIDGQGHTLDANRLGNVFGVSGGTNVTFKNITFINGYSVNGGVIGDFYGSGKNYTVVGCTFINNTATNCGGVLYSQNNPIYVYNSTFINNSNIGGYGGGAIFSDRDIYVYNSNFYGNSIAKSVGSAIRSNRGLALVHNCNFAGPQQDTDYIRGSTLDLSNNTLSFADLKKTIKNANVNLDYNYKYFEGWDDGFENGTAITASNIVIDGKGHSIDGRGIAKIFSLSGAGVTFKNITFLNGVGSDGAAIADFYGSNMNSTIIGCNFINNTATNRGGALYSQYNTFYVYNSTFTNNSNIGEKGGGAIYSDSNIYVNGCKFYNNTLTRSTDGGAIKSSHGSVSVINSVFENNTEDVIYDFSKRPKLNFTSITSNDGKYNYSFILDLSESGSTYDGLSVTYTIALGDGSIQTITALPDTVANWVGNSPLYNITAVIGSSVIKPTYYPLKLLQLIIGAAGSGSTIYMPHDYNFVDGIDTCNEGGYFFSFNSKTLNGQGYTINGLSNEGNGGHKWNLFNLGNNAILRDVNIDDFIYDRYGHINGGAIYVSGSGAKLIAVNVSKAKNTAFAYVSDNGYGGAVIWNGANGLIDNCRFVECHGGQYGPIYISGNNLVMNNTEIISSTIDNWHGGRAGAIAIRWVGKNGTLINTNITDSKVLRKVTFHASYEAIVSFTQKPNLIENVSITPSDVGFDIVCYSLQVPFMPVGQYLGNNIQLDRGFKKITPTSITFDNGVVTVHSVDYGTITYTIDGFTQTAEIDENGQATLNYDFTVPRNHAIKLVYNENYHYNTYTEFIDYDAGPDDSYGSFTDLNNLIQSSSSSVISLNKNYIYDPVKDANLSNGIVISKSITINGYGYYIDADFNPVRIFTVNSNSAFRNITFRNSMLDSSGIAILANSPVNISYCTFDNNWASGQFGAAINLKGGNSLIEYCTFTNNKAKTGAAIVVNSNNNHIQYSLFANNSKDYGGNMNYGSAISISGGYTSYINYNIFLDEAPLRQISSDYTRNNWYGKNSLPSSSASGAPAIPNYLVASLDYTLSNNVLTVGIKFTESDTGNVVNVPWARPVTYSVSSSTIIGDSLNTVRFSSVSNKFTLNAFIDNQRLTVTNGNFWYVNGSVASNGVGTQDSPFKTLNNAINSASAGDIIYIAPGNYTGTSNLAFTISKALTLERWGSSGEVIFDGEGSRFIFTLSSNVVLSSLTFINGKNGNGGAMVIKATSLIVDCVFRDNNASNWGGAIDMNPGGATIVNTKFINNYGPSGGGAISTAAVHLDIINSLFKDNHGGRGGAINLGNAASSLCIVGSTFENNSALSSGGAVIADGECNVSDSVFTNNSAVLYGGALAFNNASNVYNSTFTDNIAGLGGGAFFAWDHTHLIADSIFVNNSAADGGAIINLVSNLTLRNCYFENNTASSSGGAIYHEFEELEIIGCRFYNNHAYYDGGAVYIYKGNNAIFDSLFEGNTAGYGGGAIHSLASDLLTARIILINNISATLNGFIDTIYLNSFIDFGNYTLVTADTSNFNGTISSYFNLVDHGWDTSVKNQGSLGICWDYAVIAVLETAIKKATGVEVDLSENNLKNLISKYSPYGGGREPNAGGGAWDAASYIANSLGPVFESVDNTGAFGFSPLLMNTYHVSNVVFTSRSRDAPLDNDAIKEAVMKYGAIKIGIDAGAGEGYNFYHNTSTGTNHAVAIVGWDDNYAASNFPNNCPGDGAWIVKNSWGPGTGKEGYIYVSYYDSAAAWGNMIYVIFNETIRYSRVYQYDQSNHGMRDSGASNSWYKNTYTSVKDEGLVAFSTFFDEITSWELSVYVGDELKHTQSGSSIAAGYFTFNFGEVIPVAKGEEFTVVLKTNYTKLPYVSKNLNTVPCGEGVSFFSKDGVNWEDLDASNQVAALKVFTVNMPGSLVTINPIANVSYNSPVTVNFNVENRTTVNYIVKDSNGRTVLSADDFKGNAITISGLAAGNYSITIVNENTDEYVGNTGEANFTISKAASSVTINSIPAHTYGDTFNVNFNVANKTSVTYIVKSKNGTVVVSNTTAGNNVISIPVLNAGDYIITIANSENENYTGDVKSQEFHIDKATTSVTVPASSVVYGGSAVVTLTLKNATTVVASLLDKNGNVVNVISVSGNKVTVNAANLDAGEYTLSATTVNDTNHYNATGSAKFTVTKANSLVTINSIANVTYGSSVSVSFTVQNSTTVTYVVKNKKGTVVVSNTTVSGNSITLC